jgi:HD-like signal output (HDOD) protein
MNQPELFDIELERVALSLGIPPCPAILQAIADETCQEEPDLSRIEQLISRDVGLAATLLKTLNSPFYGLTEKIGTVQQAIDHLGLAMLPRIVSELVLKQISSGHDQPSMERFWDSSGKLALVAAHLTEFIPGVDREAAYTYGLFQNCGIPVLMQRFPAYKLTLASANTAVEGLFTAVEDAAHGSNHATIGYLLTKNWHLTAVISHAIRHHHDHTAYIAPAGQHPVEALRLMALGLLADYSVEQIFGQNHSCEWLKGGAAALAYLELDEPRFNKILAQLRQRLV